jgi:hypothetical protein
MGTSTNNDTQQAAVEAADLLRGHADHSAIAAVVSTLSRIVPDEGDALEKALADIQRARVAFQKAAGPEDQNLTERLAKSERVLLHEMMLKRSVGYRRSQENRQEEERRRAANFGRGAP